MPIAAVHEEIALMATLTQFALNVLKINPEIFAVAANTKFNPKISPRYIAIGNSKNSCPSNALSIEIRPKTNAKTLISVALRFGVKLAISPTNTPIKRYTRMILSLTRTANGTPKTFPAIFAGQALIRPSAFHREIKSPNATIGSSNRTSCNITVVPSTNKS